MWRLLSAGVLLLGLSVVAPARPAHAEEDAEKVIKAIELNITYSRGDVRPAISEELHAAIQEVVELALMTQLEGKLDVLESDLDDITETLTRVINITLYKRGFAVEELVITPGETTSVDITLAISADEIIDVTVEFLLPEGGDLPLIILENSRAALVSELRRSFQGTPTSDRQWVLDLFEKALSEDIAKIEDLSGFEYRSEIVLGPITRVLLHLAPAQGTPVIRRHFLRTRSSTLLNISLDQLREIALLELSSLDGLPISLFQKYNAQISAFIAEKVSASSVLSFYGADPTVILEMKGNDLWASLIVESPRFRTSVEGRVDFNRDVNNPRIEGALGVMGKAGTEAYARLKFFPDTVDVEPEVGLGMNPLPGLFLGAGWDFDREAVKLRGSLWLGTNVNLSLENYPEGEYDAESEYRATYKLNDDFSILAAMDGAGSVWMSIGVKL